MTDEEELQTVQRKKNRGIINALPSLNSNLPIALNTRQAVRVGLAKFTHVRKVPNSGLDNSKQKDRGLGSAPQSPSSTDK